MHIIFRFLKSMISDPDNIILQNGNCYQIHSSHKYAMLNILYITPTFDRNRF